MTLKMIRPHHTLQAMGLHPSLPLPRNALDLRAQVLGEVGLLDAALKSTAPARPRRTLRPTGGSVVFKRPNRAVQSLTPTGKKPTFKQNTASVPSVSHERRIGFNLHMRGQGEAMAALIHRRHLMEEAERRRKQGQMLAAAMLPAQKQTRQVQVPQFRRVPAPANQGYAKQPLRIRRAPRRPAARIGRASSAPSPAPR